MNGIRYEPVFGDQSLFDGAPEDAEFAGWFCQEIRWYMILDGKILFSDGGTWCTSDNPYLSADIAAMRRIIKVPTWTKADRLAGKLPEVGAKCRQGHKDEIVVAVTEKFVVTECQNMSVCTTRKDVFMRSYNPIKTPAEKHGSKKAAICELHRQAVIPVICQHCGAEYADFTHDAEFIGWIGVCAKCVLVDGVEI